MAKRKSSWFTQMSTIYQKGYQASLDGVARPKNPYGICSKGLQGQRSIQWFRGYDRAKEGKPLMDLNG